MIARVICVCMVVGLSIACFLGAGPAPAGLNSPAIILLVGAAFVWFAWPAGYTYRGGEPPRRWQYLITIGASPLFKAFFNDTQDQRDGDNGR
jgi:hypothetical protein